MRQQQQQQACCCVAEDFETRKLPGQYGNPKKMIAQAQGLVLRCVVLLQRQVRLSCIHGFGFNMKSISKCFCCFCGSQNLSPSPVEPDGPTWQVFSLRELTKATSNFNYANKLGEGGFGTVFFGLLPDGTQIAVKRLKVWSAKAEVEFAMEVEILGKLRHKNLLRLRGYCAEGQERIIVYKYMPNSSLHAHLHGRQSGHRHLNWQRRMNIVMGSAEGLEYLHHHASPHVIHRDVKSSNILLDSDFQAKVADFGFAKLIPDGATHVTTRVKGTLGYLAPEYAMWGKASESCDMYSFGILLLEIVSGKKPLENLGEGTRCALADWASSLAAEGKYNEIADPMLERQYKSSELKVVVDIAIECAQTAPRKRPTIQDVVCYLKGGMPERLSSLSSNGKEPSSVVPKEKDNLLEAENFSGLSAAGSTDASSSTLTSSADEFRNFQR